MIRPKFAGPQGCGLLLLAALSVLLSGITLFWGVMAVAGGSAPCCWIYRVYLASVVVDGPALMCSAAVAVFGWLGTSRFKALYWAPLALNLATLTFFILRATGRWPGGLLWWQ